MFIKINGTDETVKSIEKIKALLQEAEKILYRLPHEIELEVKGDTGIRPTSDLDIQ